MHRIATWILVLILLALVATACGKSDEEIALNVAKEWSSSSLAPLENVTGFFLGAVPVVSQTASGALVNQLRDKVTWTYSTPSCPRATRCSVVATARADLDISIPLVITDTATIIVPFTLSINTAREEVDDWDADFGRASVSGIDVPDVGLLQRATVEVIR